MNTKTLTALKSSIAHWRRMATGKAKAGESPNASQYALCDLFLHAPVNCQGCPVAAETGSGHCWNSPYNAAWLADNKFGIDSPKFRSAAKLELDFLISLLPKKPKTKNTK